METIFMNTENSKTNQSLKFVLDLSERLDLRSSDKYIDRQNLSIYYTWKNIRKQYKDNKIKIITPTWNEEFELPDGSYSVSGIEDYIKYIIKKYETLTTIAPIHVHFNRTNNRLVFKIKDGYKLELQTRETTKLFGSTNKKKKKKKKKQIKKMEKICQVLKWLKQFQFDVIQQIININKSVKYYRYLHHKNLRLIC